MRDSHISAQIIETALQIEDKLRVRQGIRTKRLTSAYVCIRELDSLTRLRGKIDAVFRNFCQFVSYGDVSNLSFSVSQTYVLFRDHRTPNLGRSLLMLFLIMKRSGGAIPIQGVSLNSYLCNMG